ARDPLWNPRACARIACPLRGCPPSSFRLATALRGSLRVTPKTGVLPVFLAFSLHSAAQMCF
ncbi:hypothetical protein, partial [Yersinia pestis]